MISLSRGYDSLSRLFAISHSQLHYELEFVLSNLLYDHLIDPIFEVAKLKELFTIANFLLLPLSKFLIFPVFYLFNEYHYLTLVIRFSSFKKIFSNSNRVTFMAKGKMCMELLSN